ncbi:hypothetical protein DUI87_07345 [Hirundo rustica rustica]|uniref:Uncharacterized protein n=1 Tax=Hirundo rustica rustica TaxID=333673 RepID=A0A3M0KPZ2_HIRRU|nr:hypothetical protein DUI87_07345 [Hirundo rustica rustica]
MPEGSFLRQAWPVTAQGKWRCLLFTYPVLVLMETSNSKKNHRMEKSMKERRCKHAKDPRASSQTLITLDRREWRWVDGQLMPKEST